MLQSALASAFAGKVGESEEEMEVCPSIPYSWQGIKDRTNGICAR